MEYDKSTERKPITIKGLTFQAIAPYAEGHTLTANEASVLNQTLSENLRNNFAGVVEAAKAEGEPDMAELQRKFDDYQSEYSFGVRRTGGGGGHAGDPIEKEAKAIARRKANEFLRSKGFKLKEVAPETMEKVVAAYLAKPETREEAEKVVSIRQSAADSELDIEL